MPYAFTAALVVPAPTGSHANFTICLIGTDPKMATVANGGQVVNTVTRDGVTVPADLVLSFDAGATSLYSWGCEYYNPTTGQIIMRAKIPSYTAGLTIYVSVGNAAVTTYQGGASGAEFDAATLREWLLPDGVVLNVTDFSAAGAATTNNGGATATAGEVGGAVALNGLDQYLSASDTGLPTGAGARTLSAWVNLTDLNFGGGYGHVVGYGSPSDGAGSGLFVRGSDGALYWGGYNADLAGGTISTGSWHHVAATYDGTTMRLYIDGVLSASSALSLVTALSGTVSVGGDGYGLNNFFLHGSIGDPEVANVARADDWIADEYANQSNPPVIGAFVANGRMSQLAALGAG